MITLQEMHGENAVYHGERGDWYVVYVKLNGSEVIIRANFEAVKDRLGIFKEYEIETSGHYIVGHVDFSIVPPNSASYCEAEKIEEELRDYPVLDDELYSKMEFDEAQECWEDMFPEDRIEFLKQYGGSIFAARRNDIGTLGDDIFDRLLEYVR